MRVLTAVAGKANDRSGRTGRAVTTAPWQKSSYCAYNGNCVEVARLSYRHVGVRDAKDLGQGPVLQFSAREWAAFVTAVKVGAGIG
jgi:hypothetical protein